MSVIENTAVAERLKEIFKQLKNDVPGVTGIAIVSSDGRILAHDWHSKELEPDKLGAIGSTLLGFGKKTIEILSTGHFLQVLLQSTDGTVGVYSAGPKMVLMVSMGKEANHGILNHQSRRRAQEIADLFG